jgi:hypothetical protein
MNRVIHHISIIFFIVVFVLPIQAEPCYEESPPIKFEQNKFAYSFNNSFAPYFDCDYNSIYTKIKSLLPKIQKEANLYNVDPKLVIAVVGPEMFRYSSFKDFIETTVLETLYVNYGSSTSDFSIGHFQMKPSFIEQLESLNPILMGYRSSDPVQIRRERIKRLKSDKWQIRYAIAYCKTMEDHKGIKSITNQSERIKYIATAYNLGLSATTETIETWTKKKTFPYGEKFGENQCCYGDISALIYRHIKTNE